MLPQNENPSEFYFLKGEILEALHEPIEAKKAYLIAYKEFDKLKEFESQVEYLKTTTDTLINISGSYFYNFTPEENIIINLVKEKQLLVVLLFCIPFLSFLCIKNFFP